MPFDVGQNSYIQFRALATERTTPIVAWVGSGLSAAAGLPTWPKLRQVLRDAARNKVASFDEAGRKHSLPKIEAAEGSADPWLAFEILRGVLGSSSFREAVKGSLLGATTAAIPQSYIQLWRLKVSGIINLNLDRLVTRAYNHLNSGAAPVEFNGKDTASWLHVLRTPHPFIANMHGITDDSASWALTKSELKTLFDTPGYDEFITACLASRCILFMGISADDVAVGGHLERLASRGISSGPHFWLTERNDSDTDAWAERVGIRVIRYDAFGDDHSAIDGFFSDLLGFVPADDIADPVTIPTAPAGAIPPPRELLKEDADTIRAVLNAKATEILGSGSVEDYERYRLFCREYSQAIYRAWYVDVEAGDDRLLDYTLRKRVGGGAFGTVYAAEDLAGDTVAVKILHEDVRRTPDMLESFRRGVRSMKILTGANLPGIVKYREASEIPAFVVMDWVSGPNLRDVVQAKQIDSWPDVLRIALSLTKIVRSAHALPQRVLHRDLRPANIMLDDFWVDRDDWKLVVLDFDLSYHVGAQELTIDLRGEASNGYLAPEQLQRIHGVSTRNAAVDSFGLGMTLYFVVSRRDPFPTEHMHLDWEETVRRACQRWTCEQWMSLPARFARVILACTRDQQGERWDLSQVESELERMGDVVAHGASNVRSAELVAEELIARGSPSGEYRWSADRQAGRIELASGLRVAVMGDEAREILVLTIDWANSGNAGRRDVIRWLPGAIHAGQQILESGGWRVTASTANQQTLHVGAEIGISPVVADVQRSGELLERVIQKLTFR